MNTQKDIAINFLKLLTAGHIDEAYEKYIDLSGKHHNVFTPAGFEALREGMKENEQQFPNKDFKVKQVIADGDMVAVYSHLTLSADKPSMAVVHIMHIVDGKITEIWDCAQPLPEKPLNSDGAF